MGGVLSKRKRGIVEHHIFYEHVKPGNKGKSQREVTTKIYNDEHQFIWRLQNRRPETLSKGFWHSLKVLTAAYEPFACVIEE